MRSAAGFLAQFFPLFLLGALVGKLMEDSGSVTVLAYNMKRVMQISGSGGLIAAMRA